MTPGKKSDTVRTTVVLPGKLWEEAKARAAVERCDLSDLIVQGLEHVLGHSRKGK